MDDSAKRAPRPTTYRAEHRDVPPPRWRIPSKSARSDRRAAASAKSNACNRATRIESLTSFPFCRRRRLLWLRLASALDGHLQASRNFTGDLLEWQFQHRLAGMEHNIHRSLIRGPRSSYGFPHATLDAIALDRTAQYLAYRESYTQRVASNSTFGYGGAAQEKHGHIPGELPTSRLVNALKVRMPQQVLRFRKLTAGGSPNLHPATPPA